MGLKIWSVQELFAPPPPPHPPFINKADLFSSRKAVHDLEFVEYNFLFPELGCYSYMDQFYKKYSNPPPPTPVSNAPNPCHSVRPGVINEFTRGVRHFFSD